jgi:hypothetical protein
MQTQLRTELQVFRRHDFQGFLIKQSNVIHAYLGYNTTAIQKQLVGIALLITTMSGKGTSVTDSTQYINKAILRSDSKDFDHTRKFLTVLTDKLK